jgi:hypothetical protein
MYLHCILYLGAKDTSGHDAANRGDIRDMEAWAGVSESDVSVDSRLYILRRGTGNDLHIRRVSWPCESQSGSGGSVV